MRLNSFFGLLMLCGILSLQAKTHTEGFYLYTTIDDHSCKVEQADPSVKITDAKIEIPAVIEIDGQAYSVTEIPSLGFKAKTSNNDVKEIILPEGLKSIGENAFENYAKVTELVLPNTLTEIGTAAFKYASALTSVTIGTGLREIPDDLFMRAGYLTNVRVLSSEPPVLSQSAFAMPMMMTLTVPKGTIDIYKEAPVWKTFRSIVEDGTEIITVPMPQISMDAKNMVTITCSDSRASIYYTIGSVSPNQSSTLYTEPFKVTEKCVVRAKAFIGEFASAEAHANLEPRADVELPEPLYVFLNEHSAWAGSKNMAWHTYPVAENGEQTRQGDYMGESCVWAEPHGDLLYMFTYDTFTDNPVYHLTSYDRGTFEFVDQELLPRELICNDLAFDPETGNFYGVFPTDHGTYDEYHFGYINLETKTRTNIAKYELKYNENTFDRVMNICFSPEGVAYGLTFGGRLVSFDKKTGEYNVIGETKLNINYVSCSRWDEATGLIFYSFTNWDSSDYFCTIDPVTAERREYCTTPGCITAFFTPSDYVNGKAPAAPLNVALGFPKGSRQGTLSFKAPSTTQNGDELSGMIDYRIVRKGKTVAEGSVRAGAMASVDIIATMDGIMNYSVVLSNNYGESVRVKASAFAGIDTPATPSVKAERTADGITVSWNAVTDGVEGGYIDPASVRYTVKRFPGEEIVAQLIEETIFVDNVAEPEEGKVSQYYYTVTAVSGENKSSAGCSNKIVLGYFTPEWKESFTEESSLDNFTIINNSAYSFDSEMNSGWTWNDYWRCAGAYYHPVAEMDDWLITPPMMMEKGKTYRINFKAGAYFTKARNYLEVCAGSDNTEAAMNKVLLEKFNVQSDTQAGDWMDAYTVDYVPEQTGLQYIGFHCVSDPNQSWLYLDDIEILEGVFAGAPKNVDNLEIAADENGIPSAVITFTMPLLTIEDNELEGKLTAEITRGEEILFTKTDCDPGEAISYTDFVGVHGNQEYKVRANKGDIPGMATLVTAFVGNAAPLRPMEVKSVENPDRHGEVTISWDAPAADERGRMIAAENLTYDVESIWSDGTEEIVATGIKEPTFTYTPMSEDDEEKFVMYKVWAYTPYGKSNVPGQAKEKTAVGASHKAPWHEGFSGDSEVAIAATVTNGSSDVCGWHIYNDNDGIASQDGDNSFCGFVGAVADNEGSMYTGKLDISSLEEPKLEFWVYKMGPEDINTLEVLVGGYGDWESMDYITMDQLEEGWNKVEISLEDFSQKTIQVKWIATVKLYRYVLLDNLNVCSNSIGGADIISSDRHPLSSRFYTLDGIEIKTPSTMQPCIVVTTYSDGSISRKKVMVQK